MIITDQLDRAAADQSRDAAAERQEKRKRKKSGSGGGKVVDRGNNEWTKNRRQFSRGREKY